jgi:hypothetical protein
MPLKAYEEFAQEPLAFPIGGKVYTVPPLGFRDGILLQRIISGESVELNDRPVEDGWKLILGDVFDEMVADKVPMDAIARAGFTAMTDFQFGREAAERVWESGLDPKALAEAVTQAQAALPGSQPSSSTGAARKTRSRASTTGTTSPKTTPRTAAKGGKRSGSST